MKILFLIFLSFSIFSSSLFADDNKTTDELMAEFMKVHKELEEERKKTQSLKEETESIKKVGKKLDEIVNVLEKDKK